MKIGTEKVTYTYYLGKLEVAKIVYAVDYGISYDYLKDNSAVPVELPHEPIKIQTTTSGGYLITCNRDPLYVSIKTVQEGITKIRELVGEKFVHLKLKTNDGSDVKDV